MQNARPETGWRGSREVWLEAAHELLVQSGIESVTIQSLSKRLKIARTSFYWHFEDRQALVTALADRWASRTSDGMIAACTAFAETEAEAMLNVIGCFLGDKAFDSALEFAIRSWAQSDPQIMERVHREDLLRLEAGCDKRAVTCRYKFDNFVNFQGFPHIPGDDWLVAGPRGGST